MLNTSIIQASVETFGAVICFLEIILFNSLVNEKKGSGKFLVFAVIGNIAMLLSDVFWNFVDGKEAVSAIVINRIANFMTFFSNAFVITMATLYIYTVVLESGSMPARRYIRAELILMSIAILMPIVNIFYPFLYTFTENNEYYRLNGWYAYTALIIIALVGGLIYILSHRSKYRKALFISLLAFYGLPCICSVFQALWGGAFVNAGCTIGLLIISFVYIKEWIETGSSNEQGKKRGYRIFMNLFIIMIVCMVAVMFSSILSLNSTYGKQFESNNLVIAHVVDESIERTLAEPITVANTMAQSANLKAALLKENMSEGSEDEQELTNYLASIKDGLGYQMVFAASDATKIYYTYRGLSKYLHPDTDPHDVWYTAMWESDQKYAFNVDTDEMNGMTLAVFVNMKVTDNEGNPIGICGVAVPMIELRELFASLEKEYSIKIRTVNKEGIIQIASDADSIESQYSGSDYLEGIYDSFGDDFTYEDSYGNMVMTKYISDFGWYLVIEKEESLVEGFIAEVLPCIVITLLGIAIMAAIFLLFHAYEKSADKAIASKEKLASTDELTNLCNRYALEKYRNSAHPEGWQNELGIIVMDVNGLKALNDSKGHNAGDELLTSAAACIRTISDVAYRTGGDEFRIYQENSNSERLSETVEKLKKYFSECKGMYFDELTVSIGTALGSESPDLTLEGLEDLADERMYADKSAYYKRTGMDRRRGR